MSHFAKNSWIVWPAFAWMLLLTLQVSAQADTTRKDTHPASVDTTVKKISAVFDSSAFAPEPPTLHDPHKATMRSLMLPGWGQAYNKEYWKIPIVWGALSIPITTYIWNNNQYKQAALAYKLIYAATQGPAASRDTGAAVDQLPSDYKTYWTNLSNSSSPGTAGTTFLSNVQTSRNYYRRNRDYSVLWLLILWGINVADATVFGHLKNFDISPNLSMEVSPTYIQAIRGPGINMVFNIK